jgi:uncharacterized repeat protein (TIGR04138 family)
MPILDPSHPLAKLLENDKRYKFEAYVFVFEALNFAHEKLGLGQEHPPEEEAPPEPARKSGSKKAERHLTGQQLCEAVRQYALEQYGLMAKAVLNSWGVRSTGDIGNIVFNLIEAGQMRKTKQDRREDFENVYDFDEALVRNVHITPPKPTEKPPE